LEDPDIDGRILLRWIFRKWDRGVWTGLIWLTIGITCGGTCKRDDEPSGSINSREFLD
jgi:hypothetical protein